MESSTSQRSWRQNLAQGGASEASGTLGNAQVFQRARFSGRKRCRGLNSCAGYAGSLSLILLLLNVGCSKREPQAKQPIVAAQSTSLKPESFPNLAAQAKETNDAFARKDFARVVDLTYPKVIEMLGGRDQMIASITREMKDMEAQGVVYLSSSAGVPTQVIQISGTIYAVLPNTLKMKATDGVFQAESNMIGVSSDGGATWKFIDAGGKNSSELQSILPNVAAQLNLSAEKQPTKISEN